MKVWGRRSAFNVQKVLWAIGELRLPHEHIDAGGSAGGSAPSPAEVAAGAGAGAGGGTPVTPSPSIEVSS